MDSAEEIIRELRRLGMDLFVGKDGAVHGRFREKGQRMTLEMRALADSLQALNEEAAALLRAEETMEFRNIPQEQALALGARVKNGELELVGAVTVHQRTGLCDLTVKGRF